MIDWFYHRPISIPLGRKADGAPRLHFEVFPAVNCEEATLGTGIPDQLRFERCIRNELAWPMRVTDFMNYLRFEEHSAENLKFFLWYQDYVSRWEKLPQEQKDLSPEWTKYSYRDRSNSNREADVANGGTAEVDVEALNARKSFQLQPFRAEVFRIACLFLDTPGPLELNLSTWERQRTIEALSHTTHPSAWLPVAQATEHVLRYQSYPNLILRQLVLRLRNRQRLWVGYCNMVLWLLIGVTTALVLILSPFSRGWRVFAALPFWMGSMIAFACWRGICAVLFVRRATLIDPWENPEEFATQTKRSRKGSRSSPQADEEAGKEPASYKIIGGGFPAGSRHGRKPSSVINAKNELARLEARVTKDSSFTQEQPEEDGDADISDKVSEISSANDVYFDGMDVAKGEERIAAWQKRSFYNKAMTEYAKVKESALRRVIVTTFTQNCVLGLLPTLVFLVVILPIPSYGVLFT